MSDLVRGSPYFPYFSWTLNLLRIWHLNFWLLIKLSFLFNNFPTLQANKPHIIVYGLSYIRKWNQRKQISLWWESRIKDLKSIHKYIKFLISQWLNVSAWFLLVNSNLLIQMLALHGNKMKNQNISPIFFLFYFMLHRSVPQWDDASLREVKVEQGKCIVGVKMIDKISSTTIYTCICSVVRSLTWVIWMIRMVMELYKLGK